MAKRRKKIVPEPSLAERMKAMRDRLGITQTQAARRIGVTLRAWQSWEKEGKTPSPALVKLLNLFIVQPDLFPEEK